MADIDTTNQEQEVTVKLTDSDQEIMSEYDNLYADKDVTRKHRLEIIKKLLKDAGVKNVDWVGKDLEYYFCDSWFKAMQLREIKNTHNAFIDVLKQKDSSIITSNEKNFYYLYNAYVDGNVDRYDEPKKTEARNKVIFNPAMYEQSEKDFNKELRLLASILEDGRAFMVESLLTEADDEKQLGVDNIIKKVNTIFFEDNSKIRSYAEIKNLFNEDEVFKDLFENRAEWNNNTINKLSNKDKEKIISSAKKWTNEQRLNAFDELLADKKTAQTIGDLLNAIINKKEFMY